jgi:tetratricopeptide (TPR) repeat protein
MPGEGANAVGSAKIFARVKQKNSEIAKLLKPLKKEEEKVEDNPSERPQEQIEKPTLKEKLHDMDQRNKAKIHDLNERNRAKIKEASSNISDVLHLKKKKAEAKDCPNQPVAELLEGLEAGRIRPTHNNLEELRDALEEYNDPDKAYLLAREALVIAKTETKQNVKIAEEIFAKAKSMNPSDARIDLLHAGYFVQLGDYDKALDIYSKLIKELKASGDGCMLQAVAYDLISLDRMLGSEAAVKPIVDKKEAIQGALQVAGYAMYPLGIVDHVIKEIVNGAVNIDRPKETLERLVFFKSRAEHLAGDSIKALEEIGDVKSLNGLAGLVLREFTDRNAQFAALSEMAVDDRLKAGISAGEKEIELIRAENQNLFTYYYPMINEKAINVALKRVKEDGVETLSAMADRLFITSATMSDMSSTSTQARERFAAMAEKCLLALSENVADAESLNMIGKELTAMGRYQSAITVFKRVSEKDRQYLSQLGYAYSAAGMIVEAKETFMTAENEKETEILAGGKFDDVRFDGLNDPDIDPVQLRAALKIVENGVADYFLTSVVTSFYRNKGRRVVLAEGSILKGDGIYVKLDEVKIDQFKVAGGKKNKKLASYISSVADGALDPGKTFEEEKLKSAVKEASAGIGTFSANDSAWAWWIDSGKDGNILTVDVNERLKKWYEVGIGTTSSGRDDLMGKATIIKQFASGKEISLDVIGGKMQNEPFIDGSITYKDPSVYRKGKDRYFLESSLFRRSFPDYKLGEKGTATGASVTVGKEIKKNTTAWIRPMGYGLQRDSQPNVEPVVFADSGVTYNTLSGNSGSFFQLHGGPIFSENLGIKAEIEGEKLIPLPKGASIAIKGTVGIGDNMPISEKFTLGKDQSKFRGLLREAKLGSLFIVGGIELRSKSIAIGKEIALQPYLFVDAGAITDIKNPKLSFLPWGGGGMRIYNPMIGCINLFYGWPIGTPGPGQFGFLLGQQAAR